MDLLSWRFQLPRNPEMTNTSRVMVGMQFLLEIQEKEPFRYEAGRVQKAIDLAANESKYKESVEKYKTNIFTCECPDRAYRMGTCKHQLAVMIHSCVFC